MGEALVDTGNGTLRNETEKFVKVNDKIAIRTTGTNDDNSIDVRLKVIDGEVGVQNPLPTDGDSVYSKDIWAEQSISNNFSGVITDLFDNLHTQMINTSSDNPKELFIHFNRTIVSNAIGIGSAISGDFSNVKIEIINSGSVATTVIDESVSNTKYTSRTFQLPITAGFNALKITFHTADTITLSNCVILKTRAVVSRLQAAKPDNTITDINATTGGNLKVSMEEFDETFYTNPLPVADFYLNVSRGLVPGHSFVSKFGQNSDVGTAAFEDVWDGGGIYTYPVDSTAPITHLYSTNAADTQNIEVQGLDINGDLIVQTKILTGTTVVSLDTPLWRVFRLKNIGTVDITGIVHASDSGKSVSYAQINDGNNQTLMALYTIPNGKTGYLLKGTANIVGINRDYSIDGKVSMRNFGSVFQLKNTYGLNTNGNSYFDHEYPIPLPIPGKTDIRVQVISSAAGGKINNTFDILLVDN